MKNPKIILIFLVLIIISTAGYAGWDYYNTKKNAIERAEKIIIERIEEERQWITYENKDHGFKIAVPGYWKKEPMNFFNGESKASMAMGMRIRILGSEENNMTLENLTKEYSSRLYGIFSEAVENIDVKKGVKEIRTVNENGDTKSYAFEKDGRVYVFILQHPKELDRLSRLKDYKDSEEVFANMYKSFELIEKIEKKEWKVIEVEEYNTRVKIPIDWERSNVSNFYRKLYTYKYKKEVLVHFLSGDYKNLEEFLDNNLNNRENKSTFYFESFYGTPEYITTNQGLRGVKIINSKGETYVYAVEKDDKVFVLVNSPRNRIFDEVVTAGGETSREVFKKMYNSLEFID